MRTAPAADPLFSKTSWFNQNMGKLLLLEQPLRFEREMFNTAAVLSHI